MGVGAESDLALRRRAVRGGECGAGRGGGRGRRGGAQARVGYARLGGAGRCAPGAAHATSRGGRRAGWTTLRTSWTFARHDAASAAKLLRRGLVMFAERPLTDGMIADRAMSVLADVPDPEIPAISVVDLGIVRGVWDGAVVITPTYSGCPPPMSSSCRSARRSRVRASILTCGPNSPPSGRPIG